jgi:hypothetical protein
VGWFVAAGGAWGWWWRAEAARRADEAAERARWAAAAQSLRAEPAAPASTQEDPAPLLADVRALSFERFRPADRARARQYIAERLRTLGWTVVERPFATGVNLEAWRTPSPLLLGAHYDTVEGSPGADDDASGVAALLAVARHFAAADRAPRLVFFDREEAGLEGSRAYAADDARIAGLTAGMVSVEMVGFACRVPGCQRYPSGLPVPPPTEQGDFVAAVGDMEHLPLLAAFARARAPGRPPVLALPVPDAGRRLPDTRRSDHAPFWDRHVGAVLLTDTADLRYPHYHTAFDQPALIDGAFLAGATAVLIDATTRLLGGAEEATAPPTSAPGSSGGGSRPAPGSSP